MCRQRISWSLVLLLASLLAPLSHSQSANSANDAGAQSSGLSKALQTVSKVAFAVNMPLCVKTPPSVPNCVMAALDIAGMIGGAMAQKSNEEMTETVDTEPPGSGGASGGGSGGASGSGFGKLNIPSLKGTDILKSALGQICTSSPEFCKACSGKASDTDCRELTVPDALVNGLKKAEINVGNPKELEELGIEDPEDFQEKANGALSALSSAVENFNSALGEDSGGLKAGPNVAATDPTQDATAVKALGNLPDLENLFNQHKKKEDQNPVQFLGWDVQDQVTGKKLSLFERATRRYQGTQDFPRAFTMARMELMRKRALEKNAAPSLKDRNPVLAATSNEQKIASGKH